MRIGAHISIFNAKMREIRESKNITQKQLADLSGVSIHRISKIEGLKDVGGEYDAVYNDLWNIADCLGANMEELFPADYLFALQEKFLPKRRKLILFRDMTVNILPVPIDHKQLVAGSELSSDVEAEVEYNDLQESLATTFETARLKPRERLVLQHLYGLNGHDRKTFEGVAKLLGVTRERIRQIESVALSRLRHPGIRRNLKVWGYERYPTGKEKM